MSVRVCMCVYTCLYVCVYVCGTRHDIGTKRSCINCVTATMNLLCMWWRVKVMH